MIRTCSRLGSAAPALFGILVLGSTAEAQPRPGLWARHGPAAQAKALGFGGKGFFRNQASALGFGGRGFLRNQAGALGFGGQGFLRNQATALGLKRTRIRVYGDALQRQQTRERDQHAQKERRTRRSQREIPAHHDSPADWRAAHHRFRPRPMRRSLGAAGKPSLTPKRRRKSR